MSARADHIESLAAEAEMYRQDAAAFNCTQRAEHHKEVAEVLQDYAKRLREEEVGA